MSTNTALGGLDLLRNSFATLPTHPDHITLTSMANCMPTTFCSDELVRATPPQVQEYHLDIHHAMHSVLEPIRLDHPIDRGRNGKYLDQDDPEADLYWHQATQ